MWALWSQWLTPWNLLMISLSHSITFGLMPCYASIIGITVSGV